MYVVINNQEDQQEVYLFDTLEMAEVAFQNAVEEEWSQEVILSYLNSGEYFGFGQHGYFGPEPIKEWREED
jgi:hypothetical protein